MKIYDSNLERIENTETENYLDHLVNQQIHFIKEYFGTNTDILESDIEKIEIIKTSDSYKFIVDEKIIERKFPTNARAFATKKKISHQKEQIDITYGVYVRDFNDVVNLTHELYHGLSGRDKLIKDSDGNFYDKIGLLIVDYDKEENVVDRSLYANGLNEGVTELLTTKFLNRNQPSAYDFQVYVSDILIGIDKTLLEAYFSNNKQEFISFLNNFSKRQNTITKENLVSMPSGQNLPFDKMLLVLKASIEYSISFTKNKEELSMEYQRINQIVNNMKSNLNVCETEEEYNSIKQILDNLIADKLLEYEQNQIVNVENQNKTLGYSKISLLLIINILVSIIAIFLGIFLTR